MMCNRFIFGFLPLFFTLIITVLTIPIFDNQVVLLNSVEASTNKTLTITTTESVNYDDNSKESNETSIEEEDLELTTIKYTIETTTLPLEVVTNDLLAFNTTDLILDINEILKLTDRLFSEERNQLPLTPTTETPNFSSIDE